MKVIGLLGGVASGKSLVAQYLRDLGAGLLDADRAGHEVLRRPEVEQAALDRWGKEIFGADGHIVRPALARIVFGPPPVGPTELEYLEQLTHPKFGALLQQQIANMAAADTRAAVLDAPVMLKGGWHKLCDRILFVEAPREIRIARARERGWTEEEFAAREAAQESLNVKRGWADAVIDNSGSPASTRSQVERFWRSLAV